MVEHQKNSTTEKIAKTFKKEERLCSKKVTDKLFAEGNSFLSFPLKVVFLETALPGNFNTQAGFSVGKKTFKKAVTRNRIKRKIREAYRLNKHSLYAELGNKQIAVFFIYIDKEIPEYKMVEAAMLKALRKIPQELQRISDK